MIAGNEASVIIRCLESAAGAFDKLCLVQAVGEQGPDNTLLLARKWCRTNGKAFKREIYENKIAGLQHVDDFAAARNLAFSLDDGRAVDGDWQLWLDCDDYLDDLNCRRIREAVRTAPADWNGIFCSYLIERQGGVIPRERLIRAGKGYWKNPVHETCVIDGPAGNCPQIEVFHSDHSAKHQSSAARNLTILERVLEDAPRHYFHLHTECKMLGRKEEAVRAGRAALQLLDDNQVEERYMVHLNLSELEALPGNDRTIEHLLEAVRLQPHRREAFAYLCQKSLIDGNLSDAISYFRLMDALPLPSPLPWTHQGLWYGWARNFLRVRVLRASRNLEQSEKEHAKHLKDAEYAAGVAGCDAGKKMDGKNI
jgi:tetratricopeptide (TPR) repeat protein